MGLGRDWTRDPGSAVRLESVARNITDCATRPGIQIWFWLKSGHICYAEIIRLSCLPGSLCKNCVKQGFVQGSNLALANLLNSSNFSQKASWNYCHLLFLASEYKSFSHHSISKICINSLINSVDPDQPVLLKQLLQKLADLDLHCVQGSQNVMSERR